MSDAPAVPQPKAAFGTTPVPTPMPTAGTRPTPKPAPKPATKPGPAPAPEPAPKAATTTAPGAATARRAGGHERFVARAAAVTAVLTAAGSVFGLVRDQLVAHLFGADGETDAFLVAWTVPEVASTLLIEEAMALVMIPAFSLALSRRAARDLDAPDSDSGSDPVGRLVASTAPRLFLALACCGGLLAVAAPQVVHLLAPGLADPAAAADCTRLTALTVLSFGVAGYFSAALRAHRRFVPPAAIYVAYNVGIIVTMLALHTLWGVRAAAAGVAAGSVLMVLVQLPAFLRHLPARAAGNGGTGRGSRRARGRGARRGLGQALRDVRLRPPRIGRAPADGLLRNGLLRNGVLRGGVLQGGPVRHGLVRGGLLRDGMLRPFPHVPAVVGVLAPVTLFALARQAQVLVERFLGSSLPAGAISHLNYAQKVAQVPMVLSLMVVTVTFPLVARAVADGEADRARRRVERDLTLVGVVVLLGTAYVVAYAPQLVELLFQRGAFHSDDTAATADIMRVYALGLLGHSLTGALIRPFFSAARPTWDPVSAMAVGLLITVVAATATLRLWGVYGIAGANAAGITVTALLLLRGLGRHVVAIDVRRVTADLARLAAAAAAATAAGWAAASLVPSALGTAAVGGLVVPAAFFAAAFAVRAPEVPLLLSAARRKLRGHAH